VRELAQAEEVERHPLVPHRERCVVRNGPAATRGIDQDVDTAERLLGERRNTSGRFGVVQISVDERRLVSARLLDLGCYGLEQAAPARDENDFRALARKALRAGASNALAGA